VPKDWLKLVKGLSKSIFKREQKYRLSKLANHIVVSKVDTQHPAETAWNNQRDILQPDVKRQFQSWDAHFRVRIVALEAQNTRSPTNGV
jgi:hypothetical protein